MEEFRKSDIPYNTVSGFEPQKNVRVPDDIQKWQKSKAYYNLLGFINGISTAIQGKRITDPNICISPRMQVLLEIFDKLHEMVDENPPTNQPQRFGNKAFRSWHARMNHDIFLILKDALPQEKCHLFNELGYYLSESFGNYLRIDYGTGHELSFIFFLCALFKAEILKDDDIVATALHLFYKYLLFVRRLQTTYRMEPAGSQGVWSLDDYQFVPFIWGSAQFCLNSPFDPARFLDEKIIEQYKDDYIFISCIDYINKVKTGHFAEHSNQLWSISAVPSWIKINTGLVKMYQKEILSKFPIIQHVQFGKLMPIDPVEPGVHEPQPRLGCMPKPKERVSPTRPCGQSKTKEKMPPPGPCGQSKTKEKISPPKQSKPKERSPSPKSKESVHDKADTTKASN